MQQTHPSSGELTAYALGERSVTDLVRDHLAGGCGTCLLAVRRLREIAAVQEDEGTAQPDWVRPGRLPVSTFGRQDESRLDLHYVTRVGDVELDVLLRRRPHVGTLLIAGQLTVSSRSYQAAPGVAVTLVDSSRNPIADTTTDEFGEFEFEARMRADYGLKIERDGTSRHVLIWQADPVTS